MPLNADVIFQNFGNQGPATKRRTSVNILVLTLDVAA
jgi:hypothetical protein